jgi:hypothetical protein
LIYRATSIYDLHMRIFNLQGLRAPDKPKKKKISMQKLIIHLTTAFEGSGEINFEKIVKKPTLLFTLQSFKCWKFLDF